MTTHVSQKLLHFCVNKVNIGLCHVQSCMASGLIFVVYLELLVVTFRCSIKLASCLCARTTTQQEAYLVQIMTKQIRLIRSCARLIVWAIAMASIVCVNGHLRALCLLLDTLKIRVFCAL